MRWQAASLMFVMLSTVVSGQSISNPVGRWRTQMQGALVEIRNCAGNSPCAFLISVDQSVSRGVTTDTRNPNLAMRSRPLAGLPIVWGLRPAGQGWSSGRVYNPETGQTFRSSMHRISDRALRVTGCWGPLCRSETWMKVDGDGQ
jgi:uncharacterized protein (DUF2147 family)